LESPIRQPLSRQFRVIETLGWDGRRAIRSDRHLARAAATCMALGIAFDSHSARSLLAGITDPAPLRLRLTIDRDGRCDLTATPQSPAPTEWRVALATARLDPDDPWLRHKTTLRALYDETRAAMSESLDEVIFANTRGEICEGTITNLFFDDGHGLATPPLACGLLPGVLRAEMLETGACREAVLPIDRIGQVRLFVGNSLRGLIAARLTG